MVGDAVLWRGLTWMKQVVSSKASPNLSHTAGSAAKNMLAKVSPAS